MSEDDLNQAMYKILNKDRGIFLSFSESKVLVGRDKNNSQEVISHAVVCNAGLPRIPRNRSMVLLTGHSLIIARNYVH